MSYVPYLMNEKPEIKEVKRLAQSLRMIRFQS